MSQKNNVQDSPGTSDRGQLTNSQTPYLPKMEPQPDYVPPQRPDPQTGPQLAASQVRVEQKLAYRALAADIMRDADGSQRVADAAEAAAAKVRRG